MLIKFSKAHKFYKININKINSGRRIKIKKSVSFLKYHR